MIQLKGMLNFLGVLAMLSAPAFLFYQSPQEKEVNTQLVEPRRSLASTVSPALKRCETIKRVRWKCETVNGSRSCDRDGFETVRHCRPI